MFTSEGTFPVVIKEVVFADPKFAKGENDFDVCIRVEHKDDPAQTDWWRGEMSQNYGKSNFATMTQTEITTQTLRKIGFDGDDLSMLPEQLAGVETTATVKKTERDGKTFYNVKYLGGGGDQPKAIDADTMKARLAALTAGAPAPEESKPASAPATANPFKKNANPFKK